MTLLTKDQILGADDLPTRDVPVPEWGGDVRVRGLTGTERDRFEMKMAASRKSGSTIPEGDFRAELIGRCMVDEDGKRVFTDKEIARLGAKSGAALDRVFDVVRELSGMTEGAAEAVAEDFDEAPGDGSPTD